MRINQSGLVVVCLALLCGCGPATEQSSETTASSATATGSETSTATPAGSETNTTATGAKTSGDAVYEGSISGVISDSMCGADHTKMGEMGKDAVACTHKCVEGGAKYVLVDKKGDVYNLSDQDKAKELAGKSVSIEGHIDPKEKSIHVHSMIGK